MDWLAIHAFIVALWSAIFWASVKVVDRHNPKSSFGLAVVLGALYAFSRFGGFPDVLYLVAWLVLLMRLAMWHYNLNLLGALAVTASTILSPYFLVPELVKFVGDSELRAYLMLYGVPIAVFGTWIVTILRGYGGAKASDEDAAVIPAARVERGARVGREPAARVPAIVTTPSAPIVAPARTEAPRADGKPTFLS